MEGRKSNGAANALRRMWREDDATYGDVLDCGAAVQDLMKHPGWVWIDRLLTDLHQQTMHGLVVKPKREPTEYAQVLGFANALAAAADVAATVIDVVADEREKAARQAAEARQ